MAYRGVTGLKFPNLAIWGTLLLATLLWVPDSVPFPPTVLPDEGRGGLEVGKLLGGQQGKLLPILQLVLLWLDFILLPKYAGQG